MSDEIKTHHDEVPRMAFSISNKSVQNDAEVAEYLANCENTKRVQNNFNPMTTLEFDAFKQKLQMMLMTGQAEAAVNLTNIPLLKIQNANPSSAYGRPIRRWR